MVVTHRPPSSVSLLTTHIQLCLAHYCDLHGPTPLMVTEGLPVPCARCYDDSIEPGRPRSSATVAPPPSVADALRRMTLNPSRSTSLPASEHEAQAQRAVLRRSSRLAPTPSSPTTGSAVETPPQSPGLPPDLNNDKSLGSRRDPNFRRTYDDHVTKRANPCENCALTLPKRTDSKNDKEKKTCADSKPDLRGPTLRTRAPYARVYGGSSEDTSPPHSNPQSSCASDAEEDVSPTNTARPSHQRRPTTSTSHSSISSKSSLTTHTHFLDYTSTHEPLKANTYSIVRASCLRTLSFETLPRRTEHVYNSGNSSTMSSPLSSGPPSLPPSCLSPPISSNPAYINAPSTPQSAAAGGPIFFGDPLAGYTTAYIFRIPDVHARGRKRVYAFLALSTHRERLSMKAFGFMAAAFRDLAIWIQDLAEAEAEREREGEMSPVGGLSGGYGEGHGYGAVPRDSGVGLGVGGGSFGMPRDRDSGSSFLTGGSRNGFVQRMGGSMGPGGFAPKARGLAELVGLPDFFIELHSRFVKLLLELGVVLGS